MRIDKFRSTPATSPSSKKRLSDIARLTGQRDRILNDPSAKISIWEHRTLGTVIDIETPAGGGVRFSQVGDFIGFLQPDV